MIELNMIPKDINKDDWYNSLSTNEKESISKSMKDLENGNIIFNKEVMSSVKSKIEKLKYL